LGVYSEKNETEEGGAKIKEVTPGSAAEKAGLQKGDIITGVDEIKIAGPDDLYDAIHNKYKPEDKVAVTYQREGKERKASVVLGAGKKRTGQPYNFPLPDMRDFDFKNLPGLPNNPDGWNGPNGLRRPNDPNEPGGPFGTVGEDVRPRLGIHAQDTEDGKGVKVLEIDEGSNAEKAGIKQGDIITRFDGKEVNSAVTLAEVAREGRDKTSVRISLIRNGSSRELEVRTPRRLKTANL
jgi:serine protease Do